MCSPRPPPASPRRAPRTNRLPQGAAVTPAASDWQAANLGTHPSPPEPANATGGWSKVVAVPASVEKWAPRADAIRVGAREATSARALRMRPSAVRGAAHRRPRADTQHGARTQLHMCRLIEQPEEVENCRYRYNLVRAAALSLAASAALITAAMEEA